MINLLMLLVVVGGGLLSVVFFMTMNNGKNISEVKVDVASNYVTKTEHDRRIDKEITGIKELLKRVEQNTRLLIETKNAE
mgnify:CR=1 FL=1